MIPKIKTERLRLLPVTRDDEGQICELFWHPEVSRYLSEDRPSRGAIREMIGDSLSEKSIAAFWRVTTGGAGMIGLVGVWPPSTSTLALRNIGWRSLEIVIAFHPSAWGNGYAREAAEPIIDYALADGVTFGVLGAVAEPNVAAHSLMRHCGFEVLGSFAGTSHPIIVYERAS